MGRCFPSLHKGTTFERFLFFMDYVALPKGSTFKWKRICSSGSKFFPLRVDSHGQGREHKKMAEFLPLQVHTYTLNRPTAEKANFESLISLVSNLLSVKVFDKNRKI